MKAETAGPLIMRFIRRALVCIITIPFLSLFLSLSLPLFPLSLTHSPTNSHSLQAYRFLVTLAKNLPTQSPLDKRWPRCSPLFKRTSFLLRKMYHGWRVRERGVKRERKGMVIIHTNALLMNLIISGPAVSAFIP